MASRTIQVRLTDEESAMLSKISSSSTNGQLNTSEVVRLLIRREYLRRTEGRSSFGLHEISSDFRIGRPKKAVPEPEAAHGPDEH